MKRKILALLIVAALSGCSSVFVRLPSVDACQHVTYTRDFAKVQITAECDVTRDGLTGL